MKPMMIAPPAAWLALGGLLALSGCAGGPGEDKPSEVERVRSELVALQSDPELAGLAPVAVSEAEKAVQAAADAEEGSEQREHLVFVADQRVQIAEAQAQTRHFVNERDDLREMRDQIRLEARTREAEEAQREARSASLEASTSREESERLRQQIEELNARPTDRGIVLTLRDVLFEVDEHTLKPGAHPDLDRLVEFLEEYEERDVNIQGHTDSTGEESYNMELSRLRAEAVKDYLASQGIARNRIDTSGRGESMPIASNNTVGGRQLNRRVEIIIENPSMAAN